MRKLRITTLSDAVSEPASVCSCSALLITPVKPLACWYIKKHSFIIVFVSSPSYQKTTLARSLFVTKPIGITVFASIECKLELGSSVGTGCHGCTHTRDSCR